MRGTLCKYSQCPLHLDLQHWLSAKSGQWTAQQPQSWLVRTTGRPGLNCGLILAPWARTNGRGRAPQIVRISGPPTPSLSGVLFWLICPVYYVIDDIISAQIMSFSSFFLPFSWFLHRIEFCKHYNCLSLYVIYMLLYIVGKVFLSSI